MDLTYWRKESTSNHLIFIFFTVIITIISIIVILPLWGKDIAWDAGGDYLNHTILIKETVLGVQEGQFPLFVAPTLFDGQRFAVFQYYSLIPYILAAFLNIVFHFSEYNSLLLIVGISFICAGTGLYQLCRALKILPKAALIAATIFAFSPYALVNFYARIAFPEIVFTAILPWLFLSAINLFKRPSLKHFLLSTLSMTLALLTHKIFIAWTVLFVLVLLLGYIQKLLELRKLLPVLGSWLIALLCAAPYLFPTIASYESLVVAKYLTSPYSVIFLTTPSLLFWPIFQVAKASGTPGLATQIGWHFLIALGLLSATCKKTNHKISIIIILASLGTIGLLILPFDIWQFLPTYFTAIQFPYRLLTFITFWGSLACAFFLNKLKGSMYTLCTIGILAIALATFINFYRPPTPSYPIKLIATEGTYARHNALYVLYNEQKENISSLQKTEFEHLKEIGVFDKTTTFSFYRDLAGTSILPIYYYPYIEIYDNESKVSFSHFNEFVSLHLDKGSHELKVTYTGSRGANIISLLTIISLVCAPIINRFRRLVKIPHL